MATAVIGKAVVDTAESKNLSMRGNFNRENRETPGTSQRTFFELWERSENASGGTADMNVPGESDEFVVPTKPANNDETESSAESVEGSPVFPAGSWQPMGTSHRLPHIGHRAEQNVSHADWAACVKLLAIAARFVLRHCCIISMNVCCWRASMR